ncbi:recombinase family protein [Rhizobium leguminosarum]|uniref:recombinase family protein n=1 Tax=Rhizobium leguminosarum TaxID=384 RepID=UPI003D0064D6
MVIYARYSTDQQNPASIETQLDLGASFIAQHGWKLSGIFVDAGVSEFRNTAGPLGCADRGASGCLRYSTLP